MIKGRKIMTGLLLTWVAIVTATTLTTGAQGCAPTPRYERCSNGGECTEKDPKYAYCLHGRCVECVGRGSCGAHRRCKNGACVESSE